MVGGRSASTVAMKKIVVVVPLDTDLAEASEVNDYLLGDRAPIPTHSVSITPSPTYIPRHI